MALGLGFRALPKPAIVHPLFGKLAPLLQDRNHKTAKPERSCTAG